MQSRHGCLESSILSTLWEMEAKGEYKNSVKDVYELLAQSASEKRAYTTIKTVMDRLYEKKVLLRFKQGRRFYYRTAYSNNDVVIKSLHELSNRYCAGDLTRLSQILETLMVDSRLVKA